MIGVRSIRDICNTNKMSSDQPNLLLVTYLTQINLTIRNVVGRDCSL